MPEAVGVRRVNEKIACAVNLAQFGVINRAEHRNVFAHAELINQIGSSRGVVSAINRATLNIRRERKQNFLSQGFGDPLFNDGQSANQRLEISIVVVMADEKQSNAIFIQLESGGLPFW